MAGQSAMTSGWFTSQLLSLQHLVNHVNHAIGVAHVSNRDGGGATFFCK